MKKATHKNQIVITALAVMIVVAGYLNFTGQEITTSGLTSSKKAKSTPTATALTGQQTNQDTASEGTKESESKKAGTDDAAGEDNTDVGSLDISAEDIGNDDYVVADSGEVTASEENPGEAVMVSNTINADYFTSAKLSREQTRAQNKETLMNIVNNESIASADKKAAVKEVAQITENSEKENAAELMLKAKGFEDAMVSLSDGSVDVIVNADGLTQQQIAQIEDIVSRKTSVAAQNIVITPVAVSGK